MNKMNSLLTIVATIHFSFLILSTDKYGILIDSSGIAKKDFTYNKGKNITLNGKKIFALTAFHESNFVLLGTKKYEYFLSKHMSFSSEERSALTLVQNKTLSSEWYSQDVVTFKKETITSLRCAKASLAAVALKSIEDRHSRVLIYQLHEKTDIKGENINFLNQIITITESPNIITDFVFNIQEDSLACMRDDYSSLILQDIPNKKSQTFSDRSLEVIYAYAAVSLGWRKNGKELVSGGALTCGKTSGKNILYDYQLGNCRQVKEIKNSTDIKPDYLKVSKKDEVIFTEKGSQKIGFYNPITQIITIIPAPAREAIMYMEFNPVYDLIAIADVKGNFGIWDIKKESYIKGKSLNTFSITALTWFNKGSELIIARQAEPNSPDMLEQIIVIQK